MRVFLKGVVYTWSEFYFASKCDKNKYFFQEVDVGLSNGQAEEEQGVGGHLLEEHHGVGAFHKFLAQIKVGNS